MPRDAFATVAAAAGAASPGETVPYPRVCKLFQGTPAFLRFDGSGVCLALDFPRGPASARFAAWVDALVRDVRGLPNIIKDSRLGKDTVRDCYPGYETFRKALHRLDPDRLYRSEVSDRLAL